MGFAVLTHLNMEVAHCFLECDAESELHCYLSTKIHSVFFSSHVFSNLTLPTPASGQLFSDNLSVFLSQSDKNRCTGNVSETLVPLILICKIGFQMWGEKIDYQCTAVSVRNNYLALNRITVHCNIQALSVGHTARLSHIWNVCSSYNKTNLMH